ncbi:MAG: hypothetical protein GC154_15890 [bacterium]|nr:hypothetical protein [bacterium]
MAVTVQERYGRRLSDDSAELLYLIRGTSDDATARTALSAAAPTTHDGLPISDIEVEELEGLDAYLGTVQYAPPDFEPPAEPSFSFDTSGGTQHITQSLSTPGRYAPAGKTAPNYQGAIGVTASDVTGVDITIPIYQFSETHYLPSATVTNAYKGTLFSLTGRVNNADFRGLNNGECLFLGASGSKRESEDDWEIAFRFAGSPNKTNLVIGDITVSSKKGWEYLWVRYAEAEDVAAKMLIQKPVAAYVEQVYEYGDFSAMGIGV